MNSPYFDATTYLFFHSAEKVVLFKCFHCEIFHRLPLTIQIDLIDNEACWICPACNKTFSYMYVGRFPQKYNIIKQNYFLCVPRGIEEIQNVLKNYNCGPPILIRGLSETSLIPYFTQKTRKEIVEEQKKNEKAIESLQNWGMDNELLRNIKNDRPYSLNSSSSSLAVETGAVRETDEINNPWGGFPDIGGIGRNSN